MAKGNKQPRTRVVNIPAQFLPLIEKEREDKGVFSTTEVMGQILQSHYHIETASNHNPINDTEILVPEAKDAT